MKPTADRCGKVGEPELPLFDFNLPALLEEVRAEFPVLAPRRIEVWLRVQPTLAYVEHNADAVVIQMHAVLNHEQTPSRVVAFILRHELLHVVIPPRDMDGKRKTHPPEFWEAERKFPDVSLAWAWMSVTLAWCLRRDAKHECTFVTRKWKALRNGKRPSLHFVASLLAGAPSQKVDGPFF